MAYLDDHPPRVRQFRDRGTTVSGVLVIHTAESAPDTSGADGGAEAVARFIQGRSDYGSYHFLCDSDSIVELVRLNQQAYGDGTGSNPHAIHISAATQAHRWASMPKAWRDATIENMAQAAVRASKYVHSIHGVHVPAKRITRAESDRRAEGFISHAERDPARRSDPGASFPWAQFLARYSALMFPPKPEPKPTPDVRKVKAAHISMQFSDTPAQMRADAGKVFKRAAKRNFWWVTGTEADTGMAKILREAAELNGFRFYRSRGEWVAVRKEHIKGGWKTGFAQAFDSTEGRTRHSDRGVAWAGFDTKELGRITVGSSHFLTDGRRKGQPNYELNERLTKVIGDWGKEHGKKSALVFIQADANRHDRTTDVFSGQPFTSAADEMKAWKNTGHGPIDVIASYDKDKRVTAVRADVLNDDDFDLHTDHYFVVAVYEVRALTSA